MFGLSFANDCSVKKIPADKVFTKKNVNILLLFICLKIFTKLLLLLQPFKFGEYNFGNIGTGLGHDANAVRHRPVT